MFYNDLPRFIEALGNGHVFQNSCLRGSASLSTILVGGNGMARKFNTTNALLDNDLHDYGACTVHQLLFGYFRSENDYANYIYDVSNDDMAYNDDDIVIDYSNYADSSDTSNPCHALESYMEYLEEYYSQEENIPDWDFVVLNDATRSPAIFNSRNAKLSVLNSTYIPWFQEIRAIPVFLQTAAYWSEDKNMTGISGFESFAYENYKGYHEYADLVAQALPDSRKPRVAPMGNAFQIIYEENYSMWQKLFHTDNIHPSPLGTFLSGCILYCTLYGHMPLKEVALRDDVSTLWSRARRMQPPKRDPNPMPTVEEAQYLFHVAERVALHGHLPKSFAMFQEAEASRL